MRTLCTNPLLPDPRDNGQVDVPSERHRFEQRQVIVGTIKLDAPAESEDELACRHATNLGIGFTPGGATSELPPDSGITGTCDPPG